MTKPTLNGGCLAIAVLIFMAGACSGQTDSNQQPCVELTLDDHGKECSAELDERPCAFEARCTVTDEIVSVYCTCLVGGAGGELKGSWDCGSSTCLHNGESALEPLPECREGIDLSVEGQACTQTDVNLGCRFEARCVETGEIVPARCACRSDEIWNCGANRCDTGEGELEPLE